MASKRMIRREAKRIKLQKQYWEQRNELRVQLKDPNVDIDEKFAILAKFEKMKRDTSKDRLSHRCKITGRSHGVLSKFGLCRHKLREHAMVGDVPGLVKSSW